MKKTYFAKRAEIGASDINRQPIFFGDAVTVEGDRGFISYSDETFSMVVCMEDGVDENLADVIDLVEAA